LLHHPASGIAVLRANLGAFLEATSRAFASISIACFIDVGSAQAADHRIRNLLPADLGLHAADRIGNFLDARFFHHTHDSAGHFPADGVRHLLVNAFLHIGRARNLLTDGPLSPELASADFGRALASDLAADRFFSADAAVFVGKAFGGNLLPAHVTLAG